MISRRGFLIGLAALGAATALTPPLSPYAAVINVRAFGAVGDGITDESAAFLAALEAALPGGTVYVPAGRYYIGGGPMTVAAGVRLQGSAFDVAPRSA